MTQDEIRKLLGGYATNALTADERRVLFEAALDDQELFNALQNEEALRELLDDPISREQVRTALKTRRAGFSWRRWTLGVALPALAAVIIIAVMNRANAPRPSVQIAQAPTPPLPTDEPRAAVDQLASRPAVQQQAKRQTTESRVAEQKAPKLESAPVARPALTAPAIADLRAAAPPVLPDGVRQQFSAGVATSAPLYQGPLVQYTLLRSGPAGNLVQVEATIGIAGYLALYELDAAGNSARVYPNGNDRAMSVSPNQTVQIPTSPIEIANGARLRLVVVPAPPQAANGFLGGADASLATGTPPNAPLVVDIPVAP